MSIDIPVVWSPQTLRHRPEAEIWVGVRTPGTEVAQRVEVIRDELVRRGCHLREPDPLDRSLLARVHDPGLLDYLESAHERWTESEIPELSGQDRVVPYVFATAQMLDGLPYRRPVAVQALAGLYCYDTMTVLGPGSAEAAMAACACAASAARLVLDGRPLAYALCRPPGHHATRAAFGGSCLLNNAAVAAAALRDGGHVRVAIVDVDAHHGNGTSAIHYARDDVFYGSVHVDPGTGWFPHVVGHADEVGSGPGEGYNLNVPLPPGTPDTPWTEAVESVARAAAAAGATALVVSLGVDAASDDPESPLEVTEVGYRRAGRVLGGLGLPTVVVQEGGYHLPSLGALTAAYLEGHDGR